MSQEYFDRNQQNNTDQNTTYVSQKKIDPVAQLKWINNSSADQGFGIYGDGEPVQMISQDEEQVQLKSDVEQKSTGDERKPPLDGEDSGQSVEEKIESDNGEKIIGNPYFSQEKLSNQKTRNKKLNKIEKKINKKISKLSGEENIVDRDARILQLRKSLNDIEYIKKDIRNTYVFKKAKRNPNGKVPETKKTGEFEITMYTDDFSKVIHELRHAGQLARNEFDVGVDGSLISGTFGVSKEIDAYKAQYGYDGYIEYLPSFETMSEEKLKSAFKLGVDNKSNPTFSYDVRLLQEKLLDINLINADFLNNQMFDLNGFNQAHVYPPQGMSIEDWNNN